MAKEECLVVAKEEGHKGLMVGKHEPHKGLVVGKKEPHKGLVVGYVVFNARWCTS
jgi:hypothetical protein